MRDEEEELRREDAESTGRGDAETRGRGEIDERTLTSDSESFIHHSSSSDNSSRSELDFIRKIRRRALKQIEAQLSDSPRRRVPASPRPVDSSLIPSILPALLLLLTSALLFNGLPDFLRIFRLGVHSLLNHI